VAVFHAFQWLDDQFWIGAAGVDVFFVISGFIIWTIAARGEAAPGTFLWRRLTRVAPAYWLITLALAAAATADPLFLPQISVSSRHLILSLAFIQHTDPNGLAFPVLPAGWTLNYEAIFYVTFAAVLFAPAPPRFALLAAALGVVCLFGWLDPPAYGLAANPMLLEFVAGAWLGRRYALGRLPRSRAGPALVALGLGAFAAMFLAGFRSELWRPLLWGAPAALIVGGAAASEGGRFKAPAALVELGDASYAIYLCHMPAVAIVAHGLGVHPAWLFVTAALAASIAAGFLFHLAAEKPLIAAARGVPGRLRALAARSAA